jgi:hypothetical protein
MNRIVQRDDTRSGRMLLNQWNRTQPMHRLYRRVLVRLLLVTLFVTGGSVLGAGVANASGYGPLGTTTFLYFNENPSQATNTGYFSRDIAGTTWVGTFSTGPSVYFGGNLTFTGTYSETIIGVGAKPECVGTITLKRHVTNIASTIGMALTVTGSGGIPCTRPIGDVAILSVTEAIPIAAGSGNYTVGATRTIRQQYVPQMSLPKLVWPKWNVVSASGTNCVDPTTNAVISVLPFGTHFAVTQSLMKAGTSRLKTSIGCLVRAKATIVKPDFQPF